MGIALYEDFENIGLVNVVIIIALLIFAKKAPELLKELFPKGGAASLGYGLRTPKKLLDDMLGGKQIWNAAKRTTGFAVGAAAGGAIGFLGGRGAGRLSGLLGGMGRGAFNGAKKGGLWSNLKGVGTKQAQINKQKIEWKNNNSTWEGRMAQRFANAFGVAGAAERYEDQMAKYDIGWEEKENGKKVKRLGLNTLNAHSAALKKVSDLVGNMEDRATSKLDGKTLTTDYGRNLQERRRNYKAILEALANGDTVEAKKVATTELIRAQDERDKKLKDYKQKYTNGEITLEQYTAGIAYVSSSFKKSQQTIMAINAGTYSTAQANKDMADVEYETRNEFITQSLQDDDGDSVIKGAHKDIGITVEHADNKEAFVGLGNNYKGNTYKAMDDFATAAKKSNSELSSQIYDIQTAKDTLSKSEAKKAADADRNAVGGHSGGKK